MISSVSCDTSGSVQDAACAGKLDDTGHTTEKLRLHPPLQRLDDAADMSGRLADRLGAFCKGASARDGHEFVKPLPLRHDYPICDIIICENS